MATPRRSLEAQHAAGRGAERVRVTAGGVDDRLEVLDLALERPGGRAGAALAAPSTVVGEDREAIFERLGEGRGHAHRAVAQRALDDDEGGTCPARLVGDLRAVGRRRDLGPGGGGG